MNIRELNEKLEMFLKENDSLNYDARESLRNKIQETINGATDVTLEDENDTPWIVVWFDIENDLHDTYDHRPLLKEIHTVVKGADDITEAGDGIIALFLGIDPDTSEEDLNRIIREVNQVRPIIDKYWKEN